MSKVIIEKDESSEMLSIFINDVQSFYGNYWDFDRPEDIIKLLNSIPELEIELVNKDMSNG